MSKLRDNFANKSKEYIHFFDFFEFLCEYTGDEPKDVIDYLAIQQEFIKMDCYVLIHNYPNVNIIKQPYHELSKSDEYPIMDFIDRVMFDNGIIHTETAEIFLDYYFKIDEIFELSFFAEIGLNTGVYYQTLRAKKHANEWQNIDESDTQNQLNKANETIKQQAKKIADLKAQITKLEQAGEPSQNTPATYTTTAIIALNHVISEFWESYDPSQPKTAPNQEFIKSWLRDNYPEIPPSFGLWIDRITRHPTAK